MPSSSVSQLSAASASASGASGGPSQSPSARSAAITIALDPASPTWRGMSVV